MQRKDCELRKAEHNKMKHGRKTTVRSEDHASDIFNAFLTSMDTRKEKKRRRKIHNPQIELQGLELHQL